ncbi:UV-endonuclease UvdE-domain-containing protein [Lineolata rhizophorae]|uniref:UV-endonuclease UvdE-domain-containing protein n=1 Tax=Lineolata rhizophorae TaxID=578093 RepID=A0A6A6P8W0_9PEZI|nr:UV-endonuclease UvdE-domain-containing protein [Lineolata rhizophorae]
MYHEEPTRKPLNPETSKPHRQGVLAADPEAEGGEDVDEDEIREALSRPPPVNSDYLPLPWKGRLGYACLNTYLRQSVPPVFSSRTCRIASILEHRHPLHDPSQPEHPTKNRPDREKPADPALGQAYVEALGLANARDVIRILRWNDRFGIKFLRLSSEMFPFASHEEYGYNLAPFAAGTLAGVGKVVAELGHRVTTHPGQFTQLGSPRPSVIAASIRDLEYHDEMLSLLKLPPQQDRDAVMILHMGGVFGDKEATLARFRDNYSRLSRSIKNRLVLENDDVSWSVHDLLPACQELNIPLALDWHHHNIVFDSDKVREGTADILPLVPEIVETWKRKGITPKMHYSEPQPGAMTARQRRKHNPRVATLPPCPSDMDLMIEAKDKEQAVFELMRTFKLPGFQLFSDIVPYARSDDNRVPGKLGNKKDAPKKKRAKEQDDGLEVAAGEPEENLDDVNPKSVPEEGFGMGGPEGRVYWPPGMEEWLRPQKRVAKKAAEADAQGRGNPSKAKIKRAKAVTSENGANVEDKPAKRPVPKKGVASRSKVSKVQTPSTSDTELSEPLNLSDGGTDSIKPLPKNDVRSTRKSGRVTRVSYKEDDNLSD